MAMWYFGNQEEIHMATAKSSTKTSSGKRPTPAAGTAAAKAKPATRVAAKPEPAAKPAPKAAPKTAPKTATKAGPKTAPKAAPKVKTAKAVAPRSGKAAGVPAEQRRNYIEMAAYYIAERRGFAPGNPLEDWVQAEAEIDRLLAAGRLGK